MNLCNALQTSHSFHSTPCRFQFGTKIGNRSSNASCLERWYWKKHLFREGGLCHLDGQFKRAKWKIHSTYSSKEKRGTLALRNTTCFQDNTRSLDCVYLGWQIPKVPFFMESSMKTGIQVYFAHHFRSKSIMDPVRRPFFYSTGSFHPPCCQSFKERDRKDMCADYSASDHSIKWHGYNNKCYH